MTVDALVGLLLVVVALCVALLLATWIVLGVGRLAEVCRNRRATRHLDAPGNRCAPSPDESQRPDTADGRDPGEVCGVRWALGGVDVRCTRLVGDHDGDGYPIHETFQNGLRYAWGPWTASVDPAEPSSWPGLIEADEWGRG